jgi:Patatin-like phospholipase
MRTLSMWRSFLFALVGCLQIWPVAGQDLVVIDKANARSIDPDAYFAKEYSRIHGRRLHYGVADDARPRPSTLIGIALSGGGIRSNAFQMGVLSGLYAERVGERNLFGRIDYLSSVSGGSWANAAAWAWPGALGDLFACLDLGASQGKVNALRQKPECRDALPMLRNTQDVEVVSSPGNQRKEEWKLDIETFHLRHGCNVDFDTPIPDECATNFVTKPYPIFNSTHSATSEHPGLKGFPFQSTPDQVGTIVDVHSTLPSGQKGGGATLGFFLDLSQSKTKWIQRKWLKGETRDGSELSLFAAHSSGLLRGLGVPAAFLSYYFSISVDGQDFTDTRLRSEYKLSDGGKSENTGLLPLVERGVDVLVVSYIVKDSTPFADYEIAEGQVSKLLGCKFGKIDKSVDHPLTQTSYYVCGNLPDQTQKQVLLVSPWIRNIGPFLANLDRQSQTDTDEAKGLAEVLLYLKTEDAKLPESDRFPQTRTLETVYDEQLVRAYYLLGKFAAQMEIAPFLRQLVR